MHHQRNQQRGSPYEGRGRGDNRGSSRGAWPYPSPNRKLLSDYPSSRDSASSRRQCFGPSARDKDQSVNGKERSGQRLFKHKVWVREDGSSGDSKRESTPEYDINKTPMTSPSTYNNVLASVLPSPYSPKQTVISKLTNLFVDRAFLNSNDPYLHELYLSRYGRYPTWRGFAGGHPKVAEWLEKEHGNSVVMLKGTDGVIWVRTSRLPESFCQTLGNAVKAASELNRPFADDLLRFLVGEVKINLHKMDPSKNGKLMKCTREWK